MRWIAHVNSLSRLESCFRWRLLVKDNDEELTENGDECGLKMKRFRERGGCGVRIDGKEHDDVLDG